MGRKGRDLFELLRERGSNLVRPAASPSPRASSARASRKSTPSEGGLLAKLQGLFSREPSAPSKAPATLRAGGRASPATGLGAPGLGGIGLMVIALVCLAAGFFVGRVTAPGGENRELRRPAPAKTPEWVPTSVLSKSAEEEILSHFGFPLLLCSAQDRRRAADAATWLRDQGLSQTRIREVKTGSPGEEQNWYLVICYSSEEDGARDLKRLRSLELPTRFDDPSRSDASSSLRGAVDRLTQVKDLRKLIKSK